MTPRVSRTRLLWILKGLFWIWSLNALALVAPAETFASRLKAVRKEEPKAKTASARNAIGQPNSGVLSNALLPQAKPAPLEFDEPRQHVVRRSQRGESLPGLLAAFKLAAAEKQLWTRTLKRTFGAKALRRETDVHFYFSGSPRGANQGRPAVVELNAVELDYSENSVLTWEKGAGGIVFEQREKPHDVEIKSASAAVEESLFGDGTRAGIHPTLLSQLADIFTWDVDLEKEVRSGDSFKIIYEERSRKGQARTSLRILAAELISAGQKLTAIYFEKQKGQGNYYNLEGRSLARAFLRFPLDFAAISSQFNNSRFHPILKTAVPHTGVDFAAQRGTPVRAVGDGVIASAGWNGAYGKAIDVQHDATYMSRYAHLDRLAQGIRNGTTVTKGQIIGYVGSTGRSTGPHLHFELYKDQQYVDPLSVDFPAEETIEPALQRVFEYKKETYLAEFSFFPQS